MGNLERKFWIFIVVWSVIVFVVAYLLGRMMLRW
jgi:hypothetical protein